MQEPFPNTGTKSMTVSILECDGSFIIKLDIDIILILNVFSNYWHLIPIGTLLRKVGFFLLVNDCFVFKFECTTLLIGFVIGMVLRCSFFAIFGVFGTLRLYPSFGQLL